MCEVESLVNLKLVRYKKVGTRGEKKFCEYEKSNKRNEYERFGSEL